MIVLAGGRSRRMGRSKAWLMVGGEPALLRVVRAGLSAGVSVVVVGTPGGELPALPDGAQRVDDPAERTFEGPLSGLAVGLEHLSARGTELASTAACDGVWMDASHVRFVLDALEVDARDAVVPVSGPFEDGSSRLHPLCGAVRVSPARAKARALLDAGHRAVKDLFEGLRTRRIAVARLPEPRVVEGSNTPQQWEEAVARIEARDRLRGSGEHVE